MRKYKRSASDGKTALKMRFNVNERNITAIGATTMESGEIIGENIAVWLRN